MANQTPTEEKLHYDSLINLFKFLLGLASALVVVAAFFIRSNIQDIRKDMEAELAMQKDKIKDIDANATKTLEEAEKSSKMYLDYTKEITQMQISLLKEDAKNLALSAARNKVEEAFKYKDLQWLIDTTAKKEVSNKLKAVVKEETDKTKEIFNSLSDIQIAVEKVTNGSRIHLDYLDSLSNYTDNETIRLFAKSLLIQKGKDYDASIFGNPQNDPEANVSFFYRPASFLVDDSSLDTSRIKVIQKFNLNENVPNAEIIKFIVMQIKKEKNLSELTIYYWYLRKFTGQYFNTFDSKPIYDWYKSYRNN